MTTTHTTRLDQCPPGLVLVAAHGEIPGGLAIKQYGLVANVGGEEEWWFTSERFPDYEGVPMTAIPTETAAASTDPRVRAYVNTKEN